MPRQHQQLEWRELGERAIEELEKRLTQHHAAENPSDTTRAEIAALEARLVSYYASAEDFPVPAQLPSLTVAAHRIVWLDEAEFYGVHGDAHLFSDDHYQGEEVLDWALDRYDRDAVKLASEASRPVLHEHICRVTGVAPAFLHVGGGIATLDDGSSVIEAHLPPWADPMGRRRDHHAVAREIEVSTYGDFRHWLRRFDDGAILGWAGMARDCTIHRYYRQRTGVRWDCLRIDLDTATVESESSYDTATARLPEFASFVSRITTGGTRDSSLADGAPISAGWLRSALDSRSALDRR